MSNFLLNSVAEIAEMTATALVSEIANESKSRSENKALEKKSKIRRPSKLEYLQFVTDMMRNSDYIPTEMLAMSELQYESENKKVAIREEIKQKKYERILSAICSQVLIFSNSRSSATVSVPQMQIMYYFATEEAISANQIMNMIRFFKNPKRMDKAGRLSIEMDICHCKGTPKTYFLTNGNV